MKIQLKTIRLETNGQDIGINPWLKDLDVLDVKFLDQETYVLLFIVYKESRC